MNPVRTTLQLPHGTLQLPTFLPDATLGVVRSLDSADLEQCGVQGVVMNTFHLMQRPGSSTIAALGGLHKMSGWPHPIITDSGGFQAYSLIRQNSKYGHMSDKDITFQPDGSDRKFHLTPEKSIQLQLSYGADVVVCLDDCTHVDDSFETQQESVRRTIEWARRCKNEFQRLVQQKRLSQEQRPLLFGVIQGGGSRELRRRCADALLEMSFDGFGYGGWPLDSQGHLLSDIIAYTRELVPPELPMHALGVGHPANIVECYQMGYLLFDSAMPTRDARHARLYVFTGEDGDYDLAGDLRERAEGIDTRSAEPNQLANDAGASTAAQSGKLQGVRSAEAVGTKELKRAPQAPLRPLRSTRWFSYLYVNDDKAIKNDGPVSRFCDCLCCSRYTVAYLHHLFKINDSLFLRLATIHNLRFMAQLMERLRVGQNERLGT